MLAAGARPKDIKINLMDCICLCSEVEMSHRPRFLQRFFKTSISLMLEVMRDILQSR